MSRLYRDFLAIDRAMYGGRRRRRISDAALIHYFGDAAPEAKELIQAEEVVEDVADAAKSGDLDQAEAKTLGQRLKAKFQKVAAYVKSPEGKEMIKKGLLFAGLLIGGGALGIGAMKLIGNADVVKGAIQKTLRVMKNKAQNQLSEIDLSRQIKSAAKEKMKELAAKTASAQARKLLARQKISQSLGDPNPFKRAKARNALEKLR